MDFCRWMLLHLLLTTTCHCILKNLRPLKGVLYDYDGPKNVSDEAKPDVPIVEGEAPGSTIIEAAVEAHPPVDQVPVPPIGESIQDGISISMQQQQQQGSRPAKEDLELSDQFLSAFRKAEKEAEAASCVGRAFIEATKEHAKRLQIPLTEAPGSLSYHKIDNRWCEEILKRAGCEDFKKLPPCSSTEPYRTMDGSCNNLRNPMWGKAMTPYVRYHYPFYENAIDAMRGEGRTGCEILPSPRTVSFALRQVKTPPLKNITLMTAQWGQFLDHDITFTAETQIKKVKGSSDSTGSSLIEFLTNTKQYEAVCPVHGDTDPLECCPNGNPVDDLELPDCKPIDVSGDPDYSQVNRTCMRFVRSLIASQGCQLGPREQLNQITAYIDGSVVYGSSDKLANVLRTGEGGRLHKTEKGNLLPRNCCEDKTFNCFEAGDRRANEQPGLTSLHTLWLRVHEQLVTDFSAENPKWDDEKLYQEARRVVVALMQQITYRDWLPLILGPETMANEGLLLEPEGPKHIYDPNEDATISNVFATAAYRFGHTLIGEFLKAGNDVLPLVGNFLTGKALFMEKTRPSAILQGLAVTDSEAPDAYIDRVLTNYLFADQFGKVSLDLTSLNIQRGRDHGLPPYTVWRKACQLSEINSFEDLATIMPQGVIQVLRSVYGDVNEVDIYIGGLAEYPVDKGLVGPTFACLLSQQFSSLKRGDRFFFQNEMQPMPFYKDQLDSISKLTLASLICQHTDTESLQPDVFRSTGPGNEPQPCSKFPTLNTNHWKVKEPTLNNKCTAVGVSQGSKYDDWCTWNCNHKPVYCPPDRCRCPIIFG